MTTNTDARTTDETRRAYDEAWRCYKKARSLFMDMILHGGSEIPVDQRIGHDDLTDMERRIILNEREQRVRSAWELFQDAEGEYACVVDIEVESRRP